MSESGALDPCNPTVSVIMPVFNSEAYLEEAVGSVLSQTFKAWELLAVDDGSEDRSCRILGELADRDARIRVFKFEHNRGAAAARNYALREARGRYIAFLDSDDLWFPSKLERQLEFMQRHGSCFSYGAYERITEDGGTLGPVGVPEEVTYREMLKTCYVGCLTAMYDAAVLGKIEMPEIKRRNDYALWLRLLRQVPVAHGLTESLGMYRVRPRSLSFDKKATIRFTWRVYREQEHLSLWSSAYYFSQYAVRGIFRNRFPWVARRLGLLHPIVGSKGHVSRGRRDYPPEDSS